MVESHSTPSNGTGTAVKRKAGRLRRLIPLAILAVCLGLGAWAHLDVRSQIDASERLKREALEDAAHVINLVFLSEEARIDGELKGLRTELRAQRLWAYPTRADDAATGSDFALDSETRMEIPVKGLDSLLRRGLTDSDSFASIELVVAGHDGLSVQAFERGDSGVRASEGDASQQEGIAKALWYADEVSRAVASSGRRVERGDVSFQGEIERPVMRVAIGLHEPGELVQGAVVVTVDLTAAASKLSQLASADEQVHLLSLEGRPLDPTVTAAQASRFEALAARVLDPAAVPEAFEVDASLVLGRPLTAGDRGTACLLALIETAAVPRGLAAWRATPWPVALGATIFFAVLSLISIYRGSAASVAPAAPVIRRTVDPQIASVTDPAPDGASPEMDDAGHDAIVVVKARFGMRAWLADIRGCLEREAATRGLSFDLQVEKALPDELDSDAAWLGGLVVAMGREALDATSDERVRVEVSEDEANGLRIEVDAGDVDLGPVAGMALVASQVGGHFEVGRAGRLSLVVPSVIA